MGARRPMDLSRLLPTCGTPLPRPRCCREVRGRFTSTGKETTRHRIGPLGPIRHQLFRPPFPRTTRDARSREGARGAALSGPDEVEPVVGMAQQSRPRGSRSLPSPAWTMAQRQVFGLVGRGRAPGRRADPTGRRFPAKVASACDDGRSHLPLRGSSGFSPDSLLPHPEHETPCPG